MPRTTRLRALRRLAVFLFAGAPLLPAAEAARRAFDVPAGEAIATLKRAAQQADLEIVYAAATVEGVRTPAVAGEFTPAEALDRLLAGTPLRLHRDPATGALSVRREPVSPAEPTMTKPPRSLLLTLAAWLAASAPAGAQTVPPDRPAAAAGDPVVLSPFEVKTANDDGYIARNTLSASGLAIAVRDLPQSIEIITAEMIADLGAVRLDEVLRTSAAYTPFEHDVNGIAAPTIRGFSNSFTLRDGFRVRGGNSDTFNMDRVEIVKGAAAVLYGVSEPGGMVNYIVKKPEARDFARVGFTAGNYDFGRGTLDVNRHLPRAGNLLLRLLAVRQDAGDPIPWAKNDQDFVAPKLSWRPLASLRLDAGYEYSKRTAFFAGRMPNYNATVRLPNGANAVRTFVFAPDTFDFGWDSQGPSAFSRTTVRTLTLGGELRVHRTTVLRANYLRSETYRDAFFRGGTGTAPTGGSFARYPGGVDPAPGQLRSIDGAYNYNTNRDRFADWRVEGLTQLRSPIAAHTFFYGWEQNEQRQLYNAQVVPATARVQASTRPVFVDWLRYLTLDQLAQALHFDTLTPQGLVAPRGLVTRTGGAYVMTRHAFLQDRLLVSAGARFDEDNQGKELLGVSGLNHVGQYGVVYRLSPSVSAFGLYNESFIPQSPTGHAGVLVPLANGSFEIPPAVGLTREAGLKADFGRVSFSGAAFVIRSGGRALKLAKGTGGNNPEDFFTGLAGLDRSSGVEASAAASLFSGYQVTASYVQMHARIISDAAFPQNDGKPLRSSPRHSYAAQNRYAFRSGPLAGLSLGFGFRRSSASQMELADSTGTTDTKIRPAYTTWNTFAAYRAKVFERDVQLRLTVNNVLNDKFWLERNRLGDPRMWRLGAETQF